MELHGLHAQLHDRVPGALWGVDRVHVGLYAGGRRLMHTLLLGHRGNRQFGGTLSFCMPQGSNLDHVVLLLYRNVFII